MATDNIRILDRLEAELETVRENALDPERARLHVGFSGSAAVGGDMLRAAKDSIKNTELFTVVLVVLILGLVYRSPLLIAMPLVTITASLVVATCVVALLTQVGRLPGFEWWNFKVFTTTRIFIVVILFGAGTDYFLFLASRYKEELERGYDCAEAVARALAAVGDALAASALTTIVGLGTMFFADFGKFTNSGPAIGLCLAIALAACITLAPALLRAFGGAVFWPFGTPRVRPPSNECSIQASDAGAPRFRWLWDKVAGLIVARPGLILVCSVLILLPLAGYGVWRGDHVTYDFFRQLPRERPSRWGGEVMSRHFHVGESGPLTVVAHLPDGELDTKESHGRIEGLTEELYVDGVKSVRSITDPLGEFSPDQDGGQSLFSKAAWRRRVAMNRPDVQQLFVATAGPYAGKVARFDLIMEHDPFSIEAEKILTRVEEKLGSISRSTESEWHGATFAFTGTTAGVRDLKLVTQSDNKRIQILVVLAVLGVLVAILRRPLVCLYMIATVLFSYYATIGATEWFFAWAYGADFQGLDWKVPLFLFVILVAIGQDYNVYLATRVFEEQDRRGAMEGLRFAVVRTGGIITSCGVIMAGTFSSMTSGTWGRAIPDWIPLATTIFATKGGPLPAIVQLGFALSLGVMLDTFIVRSILVPAFLALVSRRQARGDDSTPPPAGSVPHTDRSRESTAKVS
jgi:RND superfamily putative drug exporter